MSSSSKFHRFFCAVLCAQGLLMVVGAQLVTSVNLPFSTMRLDPLFFTAFGAAVAVIGIVSLKLPEPLVLVLNSTVCTLLAVFTLGYRGVAYGDTSLTADGKFIMWRSATEWAEPVGRADERFGWSNRPNSVGRQVHQDFSVTYSHDSEGWRLLPAPSGGSTAGEIWFLGCSFTYGVGVEDNEVYAYRLAEKAWPHFQVRNFSVSGWGTTQAYLSLQHHLQHRNPPKVVFYGWINHHRQRNYLRKKWFVGNQTAQFPLFELEGGQLRWAGIVPGSAAVLEASPELDEREFKITVALLSEMAALSVKNGFPLILLIFDKTDARLLESFQAIAGLHILDVSKVSSASHPNDGHPTAVWHQAIAHAIAADPLPARLTGMPQLLSPNSIPDPPMRLWQASRRNAEISKVAIRYPTKDGDTLRIESIGSPVDDPWSAVVRRTGFTIKRGSVYAFELRVRAAGMRPLQIVLSNSVSHSEKLGLHAQIELTPQWQVLRRTFVATSDDPEASLLLVVGGSTQAIEIGEEPVLRELFGPEATAALATIQERSWTVAARSPALAFLDHASPDPRPPFRVHVTGVSGEDIWAVQLQHDQLNVVAGEEYSFELKARARRARPLEYALSRSRPEWDNLGLWGKLELSSEWQTVRRSFIATADDTGARLVLAMGASRESVEIAEVALVHLGKGLSPRPMILPAGGTVAGGHAEDK